MRRIISALTLALLLVGPPLLLASIGFYDWTRLNLWLPADGRFVLAAFTVIGWGAWGIFVLSVVLELGALLRPGRVHPHLPGLTQPRTLAGLLLAGIIATSSAQGALAAPLESPAPPAAAAAQQTEAKPAPAADRTQAAPAASNPAAQKASPQAAEPTASVTHVVQRGDDLWSLAERYLGSGSEWRAIAQANPGVLGSDPTADLAAGTRLTITMPTEQYTVRHGDTLWHLAAERLGDGARYPELQKLNAERVADPDYIETGWQLRLPRQAPPPASAQAVPARATPAPQAHPTTTAPSPAALGLPSPAASLQVEAPPTQVAEPTPFDQLAVRVVLGGLAAVAASGLIGRLVMARRERNDLRELGTTFDGPSDELERFETALGYASGVGPGASTGQPREVLIDRALRLLADAWAAAGDPVQPLRRARLDDERLTFEFVSDAPRCPAGFDALGSRALTIAWDDLARLATPAVRAAYPALVTLGAAEGGALLMVDLTGWGALALDGAREDLAEGSLAAMVVELSCAPWVDDGTVTVVTDDPAFVDAAALSHVRCMADPTGAVEDIERLARERGGLLDLDAVDYDRLVLDPDRGDGWAPALYLFEHPLDTALVERVSQALEGLRIGVGAVFPLPSDADAPVVAPAPVPATLTWSSARPDDPRATLLPDGLVVSAQTLAPDARDAIVGLYRDARSTETIQAPWWSDYAVASLAGRRKAIIRPVPEPAVEPGPEPEPAVEPEPEPAVEPELDLEPAPAPVPARAERGPRLRLFGAVGLEGVNGKRPQKAASRCLEYCAWLLEHPGAVASEMNQALFVTDATRRSNLSRLRSWLGLAPDGAPYLPEAYTGRITLHDAVTSDWAEFLQLLAPGANTLGRDRLRQALELVAGAPIADAAPGAWAWADGLRRRMGEAVRDAALVLARLENERGDLAGVEWACERGFLVAPHDELIACELMRAHAGADDLDAVRALVKSLERVAAQREVELSAETVRLAQRLLEGAPRPVLAATGSEG